MNGPSLSLYFSGLSRKARSDSAVMPTDLSTEPSGSLLAAQIVQAAAPTARTHLRRNCGIHGVCGMGRRRGQHQAGRRGEQVSSLHHRVFSLVDRVGLRREGPAPATERHREERQHQNSHCVGPGKGGQRRDTRTAARPGSNVGRTTGCAAGRCRWQRPGGRVGSCRGSRRWPSRAGPRAARPPARATVAATPAGRARGPRCGRPVSRALLCSRRAAAPSCLEQRGQRMRHEQDKRTAWRRPRATRESDCGAVPKAPSASAARQAAATDQPTTRSAVRAGVAAIPGQKSGASKATTEVTISRKRGRLQIGVGRAECGEDHQGRHEQHSPARIAITLPRSPPGQPVRWPSRQGAASNGRAPIRRRRCRCRTPTR